MPSNSAPPVQKGNYQRRKPKETSREGERSTRDNAVPMKDDQEDNDNTPNPNQFIGQEDFISFDFSPSPPPAGNHSRGNNQRDHRGSASTGDHRSGSKRKHEDEEDVKQEEGTRQLRKREKERSTPWCDEPGVNWSSHDNATSQYVPSHSLPVSKHRAEDDEPRFLRFRFQILDSTQKLNHSSVTSHQHPLNTSYVCGRSRL